MSSINSVSNAYRQIYTSSATQSHQANTQHMRAANGQSGLAVRDQISISDEGLQALIDNGTLTEEEKSAIDEAFMTAMESSQLGSQQQSQPRVDPLASLIADGTITEEQRDAVKSVLDASRGQHMGGAHRGGNPSDAISSVLDSLVTSGTLTEDQKTAVSDAFQAAFENARSNMQSSTQSDPLASLVTDGTLTEDQKTAVKSALDSARGQDSKRPGGPPPGGMPPGPPPSGGVGGSNATRSTDSTEDEEDTIEALLKSLIENGTIDEEEKTSILQAFQSNSLFNWNDSL